MPLIIKLFSISNKQWNTFCVLMFCKISNRVDACYDHLKTLGPVLSVAIIWLHVSQINFFSRKQVPVTEQCLWCAGYQTNIRVFDHESIPKLEENCIGIKQTNRLPDWRTRFKYSKAATCKPSNLWSSSCKIMLGMLYIPFCKVFNQIKTAPSS